MKALVLEAYNHLVYKDVPQPLLGPEDILVQVKACGICGSDVHGLDGSTGRRVPPLVMGHEASGVIAAVGQQVKEYVPGERVTFDSTIYCGHCFFCRRGQFNLCENRQVLGVSCDEYSRDGAFAEFVAIPQHIVYRLPEDVSFERAAMVEPCTVAMHAVGRSGACLNDSVLVVGVGLIGLLVIQALRAAGCASIIAVDIVKEKLDLARRLGADIVLNSEKNDVAGHIKKATQGRGVDAAFDAVGIGASLATALDGVRRGGCLTLIGNLAPRVNLALQSVVAREITLYGSCASRGEYPAALDMIANGRLRVDPLISAVAPLAEGAAWFKRLYEKEKGLFKVILKP